MSTALNAAKYLDVNRKDLDLNFTKHLEYRQQRNPDHKRRDSGPRAWQARPVRTRQQPATRQEARPPPPPTQAAQRPPPEAPRIPYEASQRARAMLDAGMQERLRNESNHILARQREAYSNAAQALDEDEVAYARRISGRHPQI